MIKRPLFLFFFLISTLVFIGLASQLEHPSPRLTGSIWNDGRLLIILHNDGPGTLWYRYLAHPEFGHYRPEFFVVRSDEARTSPPSYPDGGMTIREWGTLPSGTSVNRLLHTGTSVRDDQDNLRIEIEIWERGKARILRSGPLTRRSAAGRPTPLPIH